METDDDLRDVEEHGTFAIALMPPSVRWHYDVCVPQPPHQSVIRPLLRSAVDCFAYGVRNEGRVWEQCAPILEQYGRRHRVRLSDDPVSGYPLLWNVHGGERGSIVILAVPGRVDVNALFPHCYPPYFSRNFRAAHNEAAIKCARHYVASTGGVAFCLPRNNGIEWMDVFAHPQLAVALYQAARRLCRASE